MQTLRSALRRIPYWAYLLVLAVYSVNTIYLFYRYQCPFSGEIGEPVNGHWIINFNTEGGPVDRAGIRVGDTLVTCNGWPVEKWVESYHGTKAGDTLSFGILRNNQEVSIPVIADSKMSVIPGLFWLIYVGMLLLSTGSLYLVYKKQKEITTRLFFIYIQLFAIVANAGNIVLPEGIFVFANLSYIFSTCFLGPILIHFHLLFPRPLQVFHRKGYISVLFYLLGMALFIYSSISYYFDISIFPDTRFMYGLIDRLALFWMTLTFLLALAAVIAQFLKANSSLSRNQMMIIFIGSFFGFMTPILYAIFYNTINHTVFRGQLLIVLSQAIGSLIMIMCILIAIFRYRIWDVEVIIRKVILYMGATLVIVLTYLLVIWFVDRLTIRMTDFTRFLILGISVITFLLLRDRIQQMIDRFFHRETYDSATVVSDFEAKLSGIYQLDELKQNIVQSLDEIFHFKSFGFMLKKYGLTYEPAFVFGTESPVTKSISEINPELEERLQKSKVFSPEELHHKPPILNETNGELVVPLISDGLPSGFFICGQKKSERMYSQQDISILALLARRVTALLHTASLYQKDLDRQLLLERERARISQDMHDDIGAGLTKIAMISEAPVKPGDKVNESGERMARVASSARDMISRLNVIVWALNPKNDNLDGLIAYSRRYFGEYLDNMGIGFTTDVPDAIPEISLSPDTRRNLFYAMQEAIHNGVKHGACSEIILAVRFLQQSLEISITDNGKGFDITKIADGGNGLLNMKKRAEELGGSFVIQSSAGSGTVILFTVNL